MKQKTITIDQLSMVKAKMIIDAKGGRTHITVTKHESVRIDINEYVDSRSGLEELKDRLRKETYDRRMNKEELAVYKDGEFFRVIDPMFKSLYTHFEIRVMTEKQITIERRKKESKIARCEMLCRKRDITFEEICELQDMYDHIVNHETSDRMMKLKKNIVRTINTFYK